MKPEQANPYDFDLDAARALPPNIRFGTSTWTYPGWKGLVYHNDYGSEKEFKAKCLEEYGGFPWFRSVGIDSTFYVPPKPKLLQGYASMLPQGFVWVSKVWEHLTVPVWPAHPRYGKLASKENPDFLDASLFIRQVLQSYTTVKEKTGPFVFQFPPFAAATLAGLDFIARLQHFLAKLPEDFRYAIEVRNKELLNEQYFQTLNQFGVTHCFNHWHSMPGLKEQMQSAAQAGGIRADFFVARILTPRGVSYEGAVKLFQPYTTIKRPNPEMRADVVRLVRRALERNAEAFIIVNNRCEGNAPMTIDAIGRMVMSQAQ